MKLKKVRFKNYKILEDREFEFGEGINTIRERNEFGKSTLIEGICDIFTLKPRSIAAKKTLWKEELPYLMAQFEMGGQEFVLEVNAQENSVRLEGGDTVRKKESGIRKFFEENGLRYLPDLISSLMVVRERDMKIATSGKGLSDFINSVFRTKDIENSIKLISGVLGTREPLKGDWKKLRDRLMDELEELDEEVEKISAEIMQFQENSKKLGEIREKRGALEKEVASLMEKTEELRVMTNFKRIVEIKEEKNGLEKRMAEIEAQLQESRKRLEELNSEKGRLEDERKEITGKLSIIRNNKNTVNRKKREITKLEEKLKKIKGILSNIGELEKKLGDFSGEEIESLEKMRDRWNLYLQYSKNVGGRVRIDAAGEEVFVNGESVAVGEEADFTGVLNLRYRDLDVKVFPAGDMAKLHDEVSALEARFGSFERLTGIISDLKKLMDLRRLVANLEDPEELSRQLTQLKNEIKDLDKGEAELRELTEKDRAMTEKLRQVNGMLQEIYRSMGKLESEYKKSVAELDRRERYLDENKEKIREIFGKVTKLMEMEYEGRSFEELARELESYEAQSGEKRDLLADLKVEESRLEGLLQRKPDEKRLELLRERQQEVARKLGSLERLEKVLSISRDVMERLRERINREYIDRFMEIVTRIFGEITGGEYVSVKFEADSIFFKGEEFENNWIVENKRGVKFSIKDVSDGTRTQLLLAARLALLELFFDRPLFLMFDEPFAYFDRERERNTLEIFKKLSENSDWQIIITSAREQT